MFKESIVNTRPAGWYVCWRVDYQTNTGKVRNVIMFWRWIASSHTCNLQTLQWHALQWSKDCLIFLKYFCRPNWISVWLNLLSLSFQPSVQRFFIFWHTLLFFVQKLEKCFWRFIFFLVQFWLIFGDVLKKLAKSFCITKLEKKEKKNYKACTSSCVRTQL
jgi:hypothetical protein